VVSGSNADFEGEEAAVSGFEAHDDPVGAADEGEIRSSLMADMAV